MDRIIIDRMKQDFDEMIKRDIPGQNHDCDLIHTFGYDGGMTAFSLPARCVCFARNQEKTPVFRTSLDDPIFQGMLVSLKDEKGFYLLEDRVQKEVNCYSTKATPCNAQITIVADIPAVTDENGYLVQEEKTIELVKCVPCVIKSNPTLSNADAGLVLSDDMRVILQLNKYTQDIPIEARFILDGQSYTICTKTITGDAERTCGTITLTCRPMSRPS